MNVSKGYNVYVSLRWETESIGSGVWPRPMLYVVYYSLVYYMEWLHIAKATCEFCVHLILCIGGSLAYANSVFKIVLYFVVQFSGVGLHAISYCRG